MATFTFSSVADQFPVGTEVGAYLARYRRDGSSPSGSATDTATVASAGTLTFDGVADDTDYVAYASVNGAHRYRNFQTSRPRYTGQEIVGPLTDGDAPVWSTADDALVATPVASTTQLAARGLYLSDYLTGAESATTQAAQMNQMVTDAIAAGIKEIHFGHPSAEGVTRWQINNRVWFPPAAAGMKVFGDGAEILRTDWIIAGTSNGLHFDQHSDAVDMWFDNFVLTHESDMEYEESFPGSWRGSNHCLKGSGIFACANGVKATRISGYGRTSLVYVCDYVSHADGSDTDTADRTGTVESFHIDEIKGLDPAVGKRCNNVTLVEGSTSGGFVGVHRGTCADPAGDDIDAPMFPGHMVYVSGGASQGYHDGLTGGDWECVESTGRGANHAYSIKGVRSGSISRFVARGCEGLATVQEGGKGFQLSDGAAYGDICESGSGATFEVKLSSEQIQVDGLTLNRATNGQALSVDSPKNTIRNVKITTDDTDGSTSVVSLGASGDGSRILGLDFENLDTIGAPVVLVANNCANAQVEFKRAVNVLRLANLGTGTDGSVIEYDPSTVTLMTAAGATDDTLGNPPAYAVVSSGTNVRSSQRSRRRVFTVTTGAHYPRWNPSLEDEVHIEATGNGSVNISDFLAGDSPALFNGKRLRLTVKNASGGTMGAIAFSADWNIDGGPVTRPTNGVTLVMQFEYRDGGAFEIPGTRSYSMVYTTDTVANGGNGEDADRTITPTVMNYVVTQATTLTADRARTLGTSGVPTGSRLTIRRTSAGAFSLNVGTGPLKAMATNTWAEFSYDGVVWALVRSGAL